MLNAMPWNATYAQLVPSSHDDALRALLVACLPADRVSYERTFVRHVEEHVAADEQEQLESVDSGR